MSDLRENIANKRVSVSTPKEYLTEHQVELVLAIKDVDEIISMVLNEVIAEVLSETYDGGSGGMLQVSDVISAIRRTSSPGHICKICEKEDAFRNGFCIYCAREHYSGGEK